MITALDLVRFLRHLQQQVGTDALAVVRVDAGDRLFAWHTLRNTECNLPGLDVGQDGDHRFATDGDEGLHAQVRTSERVVDFHLDAVNACRDVIGHVFNDTQAPAGLGIGALLGLVIGGAVGGGKGALLGALAGGGAGAGVGSLVPKRRQVFPLRNLLGVPS